jgi:autophagy-related protein 9
LQNILDLRLPWWATPFLGSDSLFLTKSLEWSLSFCVLEHLFNDQFNVSPIFLRDVQGLRSRFLLVGVVHLLLLPFMLLFMVIHFTLQNVQQFHSSKSYLGPRQWSPYALWKFREFNELKHVFDQRILQSYRPLNDFLHTFHVPYLAVGARCGVYLSGSLLAVLLISSLVDEALLLYIHIGDHNLLWYLGVFSAVYGASNSLIPDETVVVTKEEQERLVQETSAFTHYFNLEWRDRCHTTQVLLLPPSVASPSLPSLQVRDELLELFPYKVQLFFLEMLSVVLTPIVLCFSLPHCAEDILQFIRDHTAYLEGVGAVCDYSLLDLRKYGDEGFGTVTDSGSGGGEGRGSSMGRVGRRGREGGGHTERPHDGKLEQSYLSFQHEYPNWPGNPTGRELVHKLQEFKQQAEFERSSLVSSALYQSMSLHHSQLPHQPLPPHSLTSSQPQLPPRGCDPSSATPPAAFPLYAQSSQASTTASFLFSDLEGGGGGPASDNIASILRSVLRRENIDYENDFYWLTKASHPPLLSSFLDLPPFLPSVPT